MLAAQREGNKDCDVLEKMKQLLIYLIIIKIMIEYNFTPV